MSSLFSPKLLKGLILIIYICFYPVASDGSTPEAHLDSSLPSIYVEWHYPAFSGGGYSSEGTAYVLALHSLLLSPPTRHHLSIRHHGDGFNPSFLSTLPPSVSSVLFELSRSPPPSPNSYDYKVVVCHSEPGAWNVKDGPSWSVPLCPNDNPSKGFKDPKTILIGRTMFETDRLPSGWSTRINQMDGVWVPTAFHASVFLNGGVTVPVSPLFETVDTAFFDPTLPSPNPLSDLQLQPSTFVFTSVFKFEERKGYDILVPSYFETFTREDDVALVILVSGYHERGGTEDLEAFCEFNGYDLPSLPPIHVLNSLSSESLRGLYANSDVFVLPSRGEGWGRPHVEAMSMSLPIAATYWSGPTEYMTHNNSYPIEVEKMSRIESGAFEGHLWAEPSRNDLKKIMLRAYKDREEGKRLGERGRRDMVEKYGMEKGAIDIFRLIGEAVERREGERKWKGEGGAFCHNI